VDPVAVMGRWDPSPTMMEEGVEEVGGRELDNIPDVEAI